MARVSLSMFEEKSLSVDIRGEEFSFGQVAYLTIGGFSSQDMVCLHLTTEQIEAIGHACLNYVRDYNAAEMVKTAERVAPKETEAA